MKTKTLLLIVVLAIAFGSNSYAQERTFKDGTVWSLSFIKVNYGQDRDYFNSLKTSWKVVQDEAIKQGLILSYKILEGNSSFPDDYNLILMIEYKNLASMEGNEDKWDSIQSKAVGGTEDQKKLRDSRVAMRSMYGQKVMRELIFK